MSRYLRKYGFSASKRTPQAPRLRWADCPWEPSASRVDCGNPLGLDLTIPKCMAMIVQGNIPAGGVE